MSRILITGASGFLGSEVARQLEENAIPIRCTGRSGRQDQSRDFFPADLREAAYHPKLLNDVSCVIHCAGLAHQFEAAPPKESMYQSINCDVTEQLARAAAERKVRRFVFVSSVSVYGPSQANGLRDEDARPEPVGPYANSKRQAEMRLLRVASETGLQVLILRLATLYGENDPGNMGRLLQAMQQGRFVMIGSGQNQKSLLHRDDAARACVATAMSPTDRPVGIWNVAAKPCSMKRIVDEMSRALLKEPPKRTIPAAVAKSLLWTASTLGIGPVRRWAKSRRNIVKKWLADDAYDASLFSRDFSWEPRVSLEDGFRQMVSREKKLTLPQNGINRAA